MIPEEISTAHARRVTATWALWAVLLVIIVPFLLILFADYRSPRLGHAVGDFRIPVPAGIAISEKRIEEGRNSIEGKYATIEEFKGYFYAVIGRKPKVVIKVESKFEGQSLVIFYELLAFQKFDVTTWSDSVWSPSATKEGEGAAHKANDEIVKFVRQVATRIVSEN